METVKNIYFKVRNIFLYSVLNQIIRDRIGIRLVSAITRNQGWFLWTDGVKGVYDLFALPNDLDNQANYLIKYYPATDEELYPSYPAKEKELRSKYTFVEGAPLWDDRENVMADHFIVGRLDLLWEDQAIWANLTVQEDKEESLPLTQVSQNFYNRFLRALCIFNKTSPSLVIKKSSQNGTTKTHQLMTILLPNVLDKASLISETSDLLGVNKEGSADNSDLGELWEPVYIEGVMDTPPETTSWLDSSWWTLPAQTADYLPEDLRI